MQVQPGGMCASVKPMAHLLQPHLRILKAYRSPCSSYFNYLIPAVLAGIQYLKSNPQFPYPVKTASLLCFCGYKDQVLK